MYAVHRVTDGLELLHLETRLSRVLGYGAWVPLLDGVLVDSGFARAEGALLGALGGRRVAAVLNTHADEDHVGNDRLLVERFGAEIRAPAEALPTLADPAPAPLAAYRRIVWGTPRPVEARPLDPEVRLDRFRLLVVPTPGHTRVHVAFFEPERRWLFSGDLFLGVRVRLARPAENAADLVASLRRVLALEPETLFCYHRGRVPDGPAALRAKLAFLEEERDRARTLRDRGLRPSEIARRLYGPEPLSYGVLTAGDFSRKHFVESLLAEPSG